MNHLTDPHPFKNGSLRTCRGDFIGNVVDGFILSSFADDRRIGAEASWRNKFSSKVLGLTKPPGPSAARRVMQFRPLGVLDLTTGVIRAERRDCCQVSVPLGVLGAATEIYGSGELVPVHFSGFLGLIREIHCALFRFQIPLSGFGSDDPKADHQHHTERVGASFRPPLGGFWVWRRGRGNGNDGRRSFHVPLGVWIADSISRAGGKYPVSVPSRGLGPDLT